MNQLNENTSNHVNRFTTEAEIIDALVFVADSIDNLGSSILKLLDEHNVKTLPYKLKDKGEWGGVVSHLKDKGITLTTDTGRTSLENHGIGLNAADFGVAETGTLIFFESTADEIRIGTVPGIHIALLNAQNIVPQSSDLAGEIEKFLTSELETGINGRVSFITGPSRTADIERDLTIGVHGPETLAIFILHKPEGKSEEEI